MDIEKLETLIKFDNRSDYQRFVKIAHRSGFLSWGNKKTKEVMLVFDSLKGKKIFSTMAAQYGYTIYTDFIETLLVYKTLGKDRFYLSKYEAIAHGFPIEETLYKLSVRNVGMPTKAVFYCVMDSVANVHWFYTEEQATLFIKKKKIKAAKPAMIIFK